MKQANLLRLYYILLIIIPLFNSCGQKENIKRKIVYINSYHRGHPPSDEVTAGLIENLPADSFQVFSFFMDTKRNPTEDFIKGKANELLDSIGLIRPDLLVVSDDNAVKFLVKPTIMKITCPVVFCGVNWSADEYNLPSEKVTGMIEVLPVTDLMQTMRLYYPVMTRLLVLNENTTTSRKTRDLLDTLLLQTGIAVKQELVDDFDQWKKVYTMANDQYDIIYLQTNGAIKGWDHREALKLIEELIKIPTVTCEHFMMPYSVVGLTQVSREQGEWAAATVKRIMKGTNPAEIPYARNCLTDLWINDKLAEKIRFVAGPEFKEKAKKYVQPSDENSE